MSCGSVLVQVEGWGELLLSRVVAYRSAVMVACSLCLVLLLFYLYVALGRTSQAA